MLKVAALAGLAALIMLSWLLAAPGAMVYAQQPTVAIPTVTGTPEGPTAYQNISGLDQIYVYAGPGEDYPKIGIIVKNEKIPVIGVTRDGYWIEIVYLGTRAGVGWVYKNQVSTLGRLPYVTPPAAPAQKAAPTINPTIASQYEVNVAATSLPTFTPPPPLAVPTFTPRSAGLTSGQLPLGFVIIGLAVIGIFGIGLSLLRGR